MKNGFTLIELLVYMAIMGFIIVVAGRVYSDSTSMRVRTQNMTASMEEVNKVAALIKEDLSQMGAKAYKNKTSTSINSDDFVVKEEVYYEPNEPKDFSSFELERLDEGRDRITFKKIVFKNDGDYDGVQKIRWELDTNGILTRSCIEGCSSNSQITMANNIRKFTLIPSTPGSGASGSSSSGNSPFGEHVFSLHSRVTPGSCSGDICGATIVNATGSISSTMKVSRKNEVTDKYRHEIFVGYENNPSTTDYGNCKKYDFKKDEIYTMSFRTPLSEYADSIVKSFQPGVDHASIGFRKNDLPIKDKNDKLIMKDFMFYLPQYRDKDSREDTVSHYFEFSVPENINGACAVFTLAFYSPIAWQGAIEVQYFKVDRKYDEYHFVREDMDYATTKDTDALKNKKNVKAFELHLEINNRGEIGSTSPVDDSNGFVIPTPNNGLRPRSS